MSAPVGTGRRLRRGSWILAASLTAALAGAGGGAPPASAAQQAQAVGPWTHPYLNVVVERRVEIPMRDGAILRATMIRPDAPGRFPALVYRTPYGQERYSDEPDFPMVAAQNGYVVFLVDVRGRYTSDGDFEAYRNEKPDGYDTIEWAGTCDVCDGTVGSWGGSYPGIVQWLALSQDPPHYTTAVPTMTPTSSHHFFYMGGGFNYTWFDWFVPLILPDLRRKARDESGPWTTREAYEQWVQERGKWAMSRPLVGVPLLRRYAPYYYEWLQHPDDSDWWRFADIEQDIERIEVPVYLVTGWYDNNYGPVGATRGFNLMRERAGSLPARQRTKLIIGPWTHTNLAITKTKFGQIDFGPNAGLDFEAFLLRWYDARLKGIDTGIDEEPPVRIFVMGANRWRYENEWPPARAVSTPIYLRGDGDANGVDGDGALSFDAPAAQEPVDDYVYDPRDPVWDPDYEESGALDQSLFEAREDVLVYTSEPLAEDLEVTGEIFAELYVSIDTPDTDLAVRVTDVHPDGTSYTINGPEAGFLRLRYRDGLDHQVPVTPGEVMKVRVGQMLTSNLFARGHRIRLQVTSSRAPHYDPNPNTGEEIATATRLQPVTVTVHHDARYPSRVLLPVIPRTDR